MKSINEEKNTTGIVKIERFDDRCLVVITYACGRIARMSTALYDSGRWKNFYSNTPC